MSKSLRGKTLGGKRPASKRVSSWTFVKAPVFWLALILVVMFGLFIRHEFAMNDELIREQTAMADLERHSPDATWDPSWPPLPDGQASARRMDEVRALYAFAARRPEILQYIPCYCGCEREGHRSNEDCYVRGRAATGAPQWDAHAYM